MNIIYSESDQKILNHHEQFLKDFDELFIKKCKESQMTNNESMRQLLNCEQRKQIIKNMFDARAMMMPSYFITDNKP